MKICVPFEFDVGVRQRFLSIIFENPIYLITQENILNSAYYIDKSTNIALLNNRIESICQTKTNKHLIVF